jgi:2-hydroxy-3-keto-5-methylthiopentenyl-1-phosphate phosphatase
MKIYTLIEMDYGRENFVDHSVSFKEIFGVVKNIIKNHYKEEVFVLEKDKIDANIIDLFSQAGKQRFHFKIISKEVEEPINEFNFDEIEDGIHNVL